MTSFVLASTAISKGINNLFPIDEHLDKTIVVVLFSKYPEQDEGGLSCTNLP